MAGMRPSGAARLAGVIGWPVRHSRSPRMHGFWLDHYGIDGAYVPLAVRPEDVTQVLAALPRLGFQGANVTVPHKEAVFADCGTVDSFARRAGAVNTLRVTADGGLAGSNTDGYGFIESIREAVGACPGGPAVVLGAGGAARAIVLALLDAGVSDVAVVNRTIGKAEALATRFGNAVRPLSWSRLPEALEPATLLVNATSLGMSGQPDLVIDLAPLNRDAVIADIVYVPLRTALLRQAERRGHAVVDGLGMLIHQARPGFEAWFGVLPDAEAVAAVRAALMDDLRRAREDAA